MPPRAKKTDEEKQAEYDTWLMSDESQAIDVFREQIVTGKKIDNAWPDMTGDYKKYLDTKFAMCQAIKPKVGKGKRKFHFCVIDLYL